MSSSVLRALARR
jgi:hypothetical protein